MQSSGIPVAALPPENAGEERAAPFLYFITTLNEYSIKVTIVLKNGNFHTII